MEKVTRKCIILETWKLKELVLNVMSFYFMIIYSTNGAAVGTFEVGEALGHITAGSLSSVFKLYI